MENKVEINENKPGHFILEGIIRGVDNRLPPCPMRVEFRIGE
jgi:hypothetical protein